MSKQNKKPIAKEQQPQTYLQVETGIYRYKNKQGELTYHERPSIPGHKHRTYRALGYGFTKQTNLGNARTEYHRRRTELATGRNPYAEIEPDPAAAKATVSEIIKNYIDAGYPDRYVKPRAGRTLDFEKANCETLKEYWNGQMWDSLTPKSWDDYHAWRVSTVKKGCSGDRTVDAERVTFSNAFKYAMRRELVIGNPAEDFPRHQPQSAVHHCREFQPRNAEELNGIAAILFESPRSWRLGFQLLFEAYSGLRTEEVLMLRTDAKLGEPGYVGQDGNMLVERVKRGCNPYVRINDGLRALLKAHAVWKAVRHPDSPWFIPGRAPGQPAHKDALQHALRRLRARIGGKITSHGMRAFYVLVRRSQGADDNQIAWELGQRSGGALIASTYGDIPDSWKTGAPQMSWLPVKPAWQVVNRQEGLRCPAQNTAVPGECPLPA